MPDAEGDALSGGGVAPGGGGAAGGAAAAGGARGGGERGAEAGALPEPSACGPPAHAREFWKAAAVGPGGVPVSVFDGVTEYCVGGATVFQAARRGHGGGIYVYKTIEDCLRADAETFPRQCVLAHADRLLLRVLAWEENRSDAPVRYGHKLAFSYVRAVEALPYPRSWNRPLANRAPPTPSVAHPIGGPAGARGDRGREIRRKKGLRQRQADTIALEREVEEMERIAAERVAHGFSPPRQSARQSVRGH